MPVAPVRDIYDDEWLTQVGTRKRSGAFSFHDKPRAWREPPELALSWLVGRREPAEARQMAFGPLTQLSPSSDAVRYALAGRLRSQGFRVDHDPSLANPAHVLVRWDGQGEWGDSEADLLHSCCSEGEVTTDG